MRVLSDLYRHGSHGVWNEQVHLADNQTTQTVDSTEMNTPDEGLGTEAAENGDTVLNPASGPDGAA